MSVSLQPKLRFKEHMSEWIIKNILNISSMKARIGWQNLRQEEHLASGEHYLVTGTDFILERVDWENAKYVKYERYIQDKKIILEESDILITKDGSVGKLCYVENLSNKKATLNNGIFRLRIEEDNCAKFIFYTFKARKFKKFMHQLSGGSSILHLYQKDFEKYEVNIPNNKDEQQKIASFLSLVDKKIELLSKKYELLGNYKKGLMQKLFSQEMRFKQEDGSAFPDWEISTLGDIAVSKSSNLSENKLTKDGGNYKVYGATGCLFNLKEYLFEEPYISIVKDGAGVGRALLCDAKSSIIGTLIALIPRADIEINFLYYLFTRINLRKYIVGSTIPHIYFKDYKKEKIFLPSNLEQQKIASFITSMDTKIDLVQQQIEKTQTLKKGLLQQMFV